jgi:hypothetical protein
MSKGFDSTQNLVLPLSSEHHFSETQKLMTANNLTFEKADHSDGSQKPAHESVFADPKQPLICLDIKISLSKTEQLLIFENDDIDFVTD